MMPPAHLDAELEITRGRTERAVAVAVQYGFDAAGRVVIASARDLTEGLALSAHELEQVGDALADSVTDADYDDWCDINSPARAAESYIPQVAA